MSAKTMSVRLLQMLAIAGLVSLSGAAAAAPLNIVEAPLFLNGIVCAAQSSGLGRDHKLYYEAYNDASDLNGDGTLDTRYKGYELKVPATDESIYKIDYYGYFDSYKCYTYDSANGVSTRAPHRRQDLRRCHRLERRLPQLPDDRRDRRTAQGSLRRRPIHSTPRRRCSSVPTSRRTRTAGARNTTARRRWLRHRGLLHAARDPSCRGTPAFVRQHHAAWHGHRRPYTATRRCCVTSEHSSTVRVWNWVSKERPVAHRRLRCDRWPHAGHDSRSRTSRYA